MEKINIICLLIQPSDLNGYKLTLAVFLLEVNHLNLISSPHFPPKKPQH